MIDYAAILADQQDIDPIVTRTAEGVRLLLAQVTGYYRRPEV